VLDEALVQALADGVAQAAELVDVGTVPRPLAKLGLDPKHLPALLCRNGAAGPARCPPARAAPLGCQLPAGSRDAHQVVQEHLGHSSYAITAYIYSHAPVQQREAAVSWLDHSPV
jgi:integrase